MVSDLGVCGTVIVWDFIHTSAVVTCFGIKATNIFDEDFYIFLLY